MIGNDIVITVLEIHHDHIRIGIDAPRSIDVHREEVYALVQAANIAASEGDSSRLDNLLSVSTDSPESAEKPAPTSAPVARLKRPPQKRIPPKPS